MPAILATGRHTVPWGRSIRRMGSVAMTALLLVLAACLGAAVVPTLFGSVTVVIESGSMAPAVPLGSLVVVSPIASTQVKPEDVILMESQSGGLPTLHRVVAVRDEAGQLVAATKGDANQTPDPNVYALVGTIMRATLVLPLLGYVIQIIRTPPGWLLLVVLPSVLLTAWYLVDLWTGSRVTAPVRTPDVGKHRRHRRRRVPSAQPSRALHPIDWVRRVRPDTGRSPRLAGIVMATLVALAVVNPAGAIFVDAESVGGNSFTSGTWGGPTTVTLTPIADTYINTGNATKNFGGALLMSVRTTQRSLVRFDANQIVNAAAGKVLTSATLRLYRQTSTTGWGNPGRTVDVHRLLVDWTELGVTWNCPVDTNPANSQNDCAIQWNGGTYSPTATSSVLHFNNVVGWVEWNVTTDIATMIASPTTNYGWIVKKTDESVSGQADYTTREGGANQPQLVLTFS